jgi:acyl-CoA thioester hydrolase
MKVKNLTGDISAKLELKIRTYDIDIAGHVNNAVYIKWFEDLRTKLFKEYFKLPELLSNNLYPVVVSTEIKYKKFLKLFDKPIGIMCIESFHHGIFILKAEISFDEKLIASGKQKCVLFDLVKLEIVKHKKLMRIINSNPGLFELA